MIFARSNYNTAQYYDTFSLHFRTIQSLVPIFRNRCMYYIE